MIIAFYDYLYFYIFPLSAIYAIYGVLVPFSGINIVSILFTIITLYYSLILNVQDKKGSR